MDKKITEYRFKEQMKNKSIIVGLTYLHKDGSISHRVQFSGVIVGLDNRGLIIICNEDRKEFTLPPFESAYEKAPEGEYKMKTSGEIVINPDYMTAWTINLNEE